MNKLGFGICDLRFGLIIAFIFIIAFVATFNYAVARLLASQPVRKFSNGVKVRCLFLFLFVFFLTGQGGCGGVGDSSSGSSTPPVQSAPSVTTNTATNITQVSVTLNGTVNPNGVATNVYFQFGTSITYGSTTVSQDIGSGTTSINVSANITGLSPNTTYNFRIRAIKDGTTGIVYNGANKTFTTEALPPTCITNAATNITTTSARLNGTVIPNGVATTAYFNYGLTTSYGNTTASQAIGNGTINVAVTADISGLSLNTGYNFRVVGSSNSGTNYGNNLIFTTGNSPGSAPTCITDAADNITTISVGLNGTVIPNGVATTAYFNYGLTTSYTVTTTAQTIGSGITSVAITATAGSLTPNTLYNFRVAAFNSYGTTSGNNLTFNTASIIASSLFVQQPTNTTAGATITPPVTVRVTDQYNNPVPNVAVSLTTTTQLNGTTTQLSNTSGIATFNNLSITTTGIYQLTARVPTDSVGINSNSFTITPYIPNSLVFVQQPTTTTAGATITPAVTVSVKDVYANPVSGVSISITTTNGTVINGTLTQNSDVNGIATFYNLSISIVGNSYVLSATAGAISTTSSTFNIVSNNANLSSLTISQGTLNPSFAPATINYTVDVPLTQSSIIVTPTAAETTATITVNATPVPSGQVSNPISLNLGPNQISIVVTAPDSVTTKTYTITVNRLYQQAYIKASNTETSDCFGYSVAMSGDTLVVGAVGILSDVLNGEDSNITGTGNSGISTNNSAADSGAVYVFTRSGNTWSQQAYIKASNTGANDYFGFSVAISGDTLVVGAYGEDSNTTGINGNQADDSFYNSGAVYVFTRSGNTWSQQAYIKASNTGVNDNFGYSVSLSGDTLVVGALYESSNATGINGDGADNSALYSGAAYVFQRSGTIWSQQAYIKASNTGAYDNFGISVAISSDTLVVGAVYEDSNATGIDGDGTNNSAADSGAAYIFTRSGTIWSQQAYIKASNTGADDLFGFSVAISGDTLVVGAYQENSSTTGINSTPNESAADSGAAYVFQRSGTIWSQQAYIKTSNTGTGDWFGVNVAISGDTLLVGAVYETSNATGINGNQTNNSVSESGAVYLFTRSGTTWSQQAYIKASNTGAGDNFGYSIAISGDTFVVSGYGESSSATGINGNQTNNSAVESGAVYVFR